MCKLCEKNIIFINIINIDKIKRKKIKIKKIKKNKNDIRIQIIKKYNFFFN